MMAANMIAKKKKFAASYARDVIEVPAFKLVFMAFCLFYLL